MQFINEEWYNRAVAELAYIFPPEVFKYDPPVPSCCRDRDMQIILRNREHEIARFRIVPNHSSLGGPFLEYVQPSWSPEMQIRVYRDQTIEIEERKRIRAIHEEALKKEAERLAVIKERQAKIEQRKAIAAEKRALKKAQREAAATNPPDAEELPPVEHVETERDREARAFQRDVFALSGNNPWIDQVEEN
jgi:hypothetical protein